MIICVSGTPATGKSTIAKILSKELKFKYIDVKAIIKKNKLYDCYDKKLKTYIVDEKKLNKFLINNIINSNIDLIIDSHLSHYLPKKYVDLCIITKCDLKQLKKRLEKRKYSSEKVRENLDSEIFDVCLNEAKELNHHIFVINTTKGINKELLNSLTGEINAIKSRSRTAK
jgi:adenylate kinase